MVRTTSRGCRPKRKLSSVAENSINKFYLHHLYFLPLSSSIFFNADGCEATSNAGRSHSMHSLAKPEFAMEPISLSFIGTHTS